MEEIKFNIYCPTKRYVKIKFNTSQCQKNIIRKKKKLLRKISLHAPQKHIVQSCYEGNA